MHSVDEFQGEVVLIEDTVTPTAATPKKPKYNVDQRSNIKKERKPWAKKRTLLKNETGNLTEYEQAVIDFVKQPEPEPDRISNFCKWLEAEIRNRDEASQRTVMKHITSLIFEN
ncbi:uncharacterized protein [Antedon mediterranea]|uniref:uncharacterized protein n=1 Tax=Antedon mediterranea TaxID=105859 RepID=UPI003AF6CEDF